VSVQPGQLALALDDLGVGREYVRKLAVKAYADIVGKLGMGGHQSPRRAHDEFKVGDVITILRADHQEFILVGRPSVKPVPTIKHEYFERSDTVVEGEVLHFVDMPRLDRGDVIAVVDPKPPVRLLEHFGHEVAVGAASVEIILPGANV